MKIREPEARYITKDASDSLIAKFGWSRKEWMQDWPLEISNEIVIDDCLKEYRLINDADKKFLLMKAILYALEEVENENDFEYYGGQVSNLLNMDFDIHKYTIYYWTLYNNPEFEEFKITPLLRKVWNDKD